MDNHIQLNSKSKIYVFCPAFFKTGGTELLHQLAYWLGCYKRKANMVYIDATADRNINPAFRQYVTDYLNLEDVIDDENNICILPETLTNYARMFEKCKKVVWWESVDNYLFLSSIVYNVKIRNYKQVLRLLKHKMLMSPKRQLSIKELQKVDYHLVQSYYAKDFVEKHNIRHVLYLSDYINDTYINNLNKVDISKKQNIVCYNPKKGKQFTEQIIKKASKLNIKFVPIINMSNDQVRDLLTKAKVYIDFGNHPGKDRFPREAAVSMCCVITGQKGSANFYDDVKIPSKYKFKDKKKNIEAIVKQIEFCVNSYETSINDFKIYREYIMSEKEYFKQCIENIFK